MLAERLARIEDRIQAACARAGRARDDVALVAVSKSVSLARIREATDLGLTHFGESYAQELRDKSGEVSAAVQWHFIGRIQTNKAKYVAPSAVRVHALETCRQAEALARRRSTEAPLACLLAVHLGGEATKGGVAPDQALDRGAELREIPGIRVVGLMTLPPRHEDPTRSAPFFAQLRELAERGRQEGHPWTELSMGMSNDFDVAVEHGATWIRVGTALFGPRHAG